MLYRKIFDFLDEWKKSKNKKALYITGARQIGKTTTVREFSKNYKTFVEINFLTMPNAKDIFEGDLEADTIITKLTSYVKKDLEVNNTLIFFDEIQECPNARTAIKFLVSDGRFDYIESGSLLGINFKEVKSYPVGFEEIVEMHPMDFEEFCYANNVKKSSVEYIKECFDNKKEVMSSIHNDFMKLFNLFIIVGGMPNVVQTYINTHDIGLVLKEQKSIMDLYRLDITKYCSGSKDKIKSIFDLIPSELNKEDRRFVLTDINKNARSRRYDSSFMWLADAGVSIPVYNVKAPVIPLKINEERNLFKLFLVDSGLLCSTALDNVQYKILNNDLTVNMGSILENVIASELNKNGLNLNYYRDKKIGEIDFVIVKNGKIIPIEVKSGNDYRKHLALNKLLNSEFNINEGIVLSKFNLEKEANVIYYPLYMIMFIKNNLIEKDSIYQISLSI